MPARRHVHAVALALCCTAVALAALPAGEAVRPAARAAAGPVLTGADARAGAAPAALSDGIGGLDLPAHPAAASAAPAAASPAERACGGLPPFTTAAQAGAAQVMAGQLAVPGFRTATIDPRRDGDVNWTADPYHNPTWVQDFQSGEWIQDLISGYLAGGKQAAADQARARVITKGWLNAFGVSARDPRTLVCIAIAFPGESWIQDQIPPTVNYYAAHWLGPWNHGLMQDIKLLRIGCGYRATAFHGDALTWRTTAVRQLTAMFEPNYLGPAIDAEGAANEQATLYEDFVYNLWRTALPMLKACGYALPSWITRRIAKLPAFLAYATEPDGNLVQLGDTYVEHSAAHPPEKNLVAVYSAGYVFGRSGWSKSASFYSLRFGRGRQVHGHSDHMSLTYYARGRNLIVNAGHAGYENTPYRAWLRSPEAASMLVMPGVPFSGATATSLIADKIGPYGQFYEFYDTAFSGHPRYRSVYISQRPDLVVVFDRASGAGTYQQLWHLDPALAVTRLTSSGAIATAAGAQLELLQVPLPGQVIPPGSTTVVRAQTSPAYQGWVSRQMLQRLPADVVEMTRTGYSAAILTLIVPAAPGTPVSDSVSGSAAGPYQLTVRVGGSVTAYAVTADGTITAA
jgi:hypothetical protein